MYSSCANKKQIFNKNAVWFNQLPFKDYLLPIWMVNFTGHGYPYFDKVYNYVGIGGT